jgi:hypothetical protein
MMAISPATETGTAALVTRAAAGDFDAWSALVDGYQNAAFGLAVAWGGWDNARSSGACCNPVPIRN